MTEERQDIRISSGLRLDSIEIFKTQKMPCTAVFMASLCRWLTKVEGQWVQAIITLLVKTIPTGQDTSQINVDKYMNQNLLTKKCFEVGNWSQCQVSGSHQTQSLRVSQKQHPPGSSMLLEEGCCNSRPPVGIVLAGRLRQNLIPTLILHGDRGNLQVALYRAYLKRVGEAPQKSFDGLGSKRHCDRLNNNIFCMFLYS